MNGYDRRLNDAEDNFDLFRELTYPGRGIVLGRDETGRYMVQIYWIMGRSENSQNRVFSVDSERVFTEPVDPTKVKDPRLIIYDAMQAEGDYFVVSNGEQTGTVLSELCAGKKLTSSLKGFTYEPDAPNYTPRITGACNRIGGLYAFGLAMLKKSPFDDSCQRVSYYYEEIPNGLGFCITTYDREADPLPPFSGEPILLPIMGDIEMVARGYWDALNRRNRVSLVVKFIDEVPKGSNLPANSDIRVINRFQKVDLKG